MTMRTILLSVLCLSLAGVVIAANADYDWQPRVSYCCTQVVDKTRFSIDTQSNVFLWDDRIGQKPTIVKLMAPKESDVQTWWAVTNANSSAAAQITPAMQALMDAVNKRLTSTNQITLKEITTGTTNKISAASAVAGGSAE